MKPHERLLEAATMALFALMGTAVASLFTVTLFEALIVGLATAIIIKVIDP